MPEERRAADQKIKEENLFKSLGAGQQEAETEGFQCGRCKQVSQVYVIVKFEVNIMQRKCRYRQAQTRSADEPMTVSDCSTELLLFLMTPDKTFVT